MKEFTHQSNFTLNFYIEIISLGKGSGLSMQLIFLV